MVKALARAFRWRKMLDDGVHVTIEELAKSKGIAKTYVSQILRLTLLAPEIVEGILDGRQSEELQLDDLLATSLWIGSGRLMLGDQPTGRLPPTGDRFLKRHF
jgi:hypothetical protein